MVASLVQFKARTLRGRVGIGMIFVERGVQKTVGKYLRTCPAILLKENDKEGDEKSEILF